MASTSRYAGQRSALVVALKQQNRLESSYMTMGPPRGNRNAAKAKVFEGALRRAIAQSDDPDKLRTIAEKLVELASGGNLYAIGMIADRLDGKAVQTLAGDPDRPLTGDRFSASDAELMAQLQKAAQSGRADRVN